MRRALLAALVAAFFVVPGVATANPPDSDPTCEHGTQSGSECAGDNGDEGCTGITVAEGTPADEYAEDAFDLVTDTLGAGNENDCDPSNDG